MDFRFRNLDIIYVTDINSVLNSQFMFCVFPILFFQSGLSLGTDRK